MIIVDGFNVYPSEVEAVLYTHPAVRLAAVIGVPDTVSRRDRAGPASRSRPARPRRPRTSSRTAGPACTEYKVPRQRRDARHAADERGRQDSLPRAARRARAAHRPSADEPRSTMAVASRPERALSGLEFFQEDDRRRAAAAADAGAARHPARRSATRDASSSPATASSAVLQRHGRRPRRLRGDAARLVARLLRSTR